MYAQKYFKKIALVFIILFSSILIFSIYLIFEVNANMKKYGGEMPDGFFLIFLFFTVLHSLIFLMWSCKLYSQKISKENTLFQLLLILLLGLILPSVIFLRMDVVISLLY